MVKKGQSISEYHFENIRKSTIRRKLILKQRKKLDSKTLQNYLA